MKNKKLLGLVILPLTLALTSCGLFDMFKQLEELTYKSLDEFFEKNNYTGTESVSSFNSIMREHVHQWDHTVQTYTNTSDTDVTDYSPRGDSILYDDDATIIRSKHSELFYFFHDSTNYFLKYSFEEVDPIYVEMDNTLKFAYYGEFNRHDMDEEHQNTLKMHIYEDGYLFVSFKNTMIYASKDLDAFYINVDNSNVFQNYDGSFTVPTSELLTSALADAPSSREFNIPIPEGYEQKIYHKDYLDSDDNHFIAYDVILPYVDILDYVALIKSSGLEIYQGEYHPLFDLDGIRGGEYIFYDLDHEYCVHLQYEYPIAVIIGDNNYGVRMRVQRAKYQFSYFGETPNTQDDWTQSDKDKMMECYGYVLPFINLGRHYSVSTVKRANGEHPLISPLDMDVKCYWITDSFYKDLITESYGELLEKDGFHFYEPPSDQEARIAWKDSEDVKYAEMYINDELDLSIKFMFDDIYGNTIKIFKTSELLSWHNMANEDDTNS